MTYTIRNRVEKRVERLINEGKFNPNPKTDKQFNKNMKVLKLNCREFQAWLNNMSDAKARNHCKKR